ncbi:UNVERIFIED_CONTAM: hypothetical protein GTU68_060564 [Idotea baltica]|nr:hypothetical protein [Idotea baltica]
MRPGVMLQDIVVDID